MHINYNMSYKKTSSDIIFQKQREVLDVILNYALLAPFCSGVFEVMILHMISSVSDIHDDSCISRNMFNL
jgi:hypothetical protein